MLITDLILDDTSEPYGNLRFGLDELLDAYGSPVRDLSELPSVLECLTDRVAIFHALPHQVMDEDDDCVTIPMTVTATDKNGNPACWLVDVTAYIDERL